MSIVGWLQLAQALIGPASSVLLLLLFVGGLWKGVLHWDSEFQRESRRADRFEALATESTSLAKWAADVFVAAATGRPMPQAFVPPAQPPPPNSATPTSGKVAPP